MGRCHRRDMGGRTGSRKTSVIWQEVELAPVRDRRPLAFCDHDAGGVVALFAVAGISQRKYERVLGPDEPQSRARGLYLRDEGLDDPTFFGDARYAVELLVLHGLVASPAFVTCAG
jgi:hypothetical protein